MNNCDFKQHFINILSLLAVEDYKNRQYIVTPIYEKHKKYLGVYDDIMRLCVLPKTRKFTFDEFLKTFSFWEGYYPCWIEITKTEEAVYMDTSLRMRKAGNKDDGKYYPFRIKNAEFEFKRLNI